MLTVLFFIVIGAVIGSFCNVVIYRLPRMMKGESLSLSFPHSHCPYCKKPVQVRHNIPIIGWLMLRGRCFYCHHRISARYPLVELFTALMFGFVIFKLGVTAQSVIDLAIISLLIPLFFIDLETGLLPDRLTYPLIVLALILALSGNGHIGFLHALVAGIIGFGLPWLLDKFYYWRHKKSGMGMGDMKLFAGLGAWMGITGLFNIMILSCVLAILSAIFLLKRGRGETFPFGPYLVIAALIWEVVKIM